MARVAAAWAGAAVGLTFGACFIKPSAPGSDDPDAGTDALAVGDSGTACALRDDFTSTTLPLCGDWGLREGSALAGGNQNFYRSNSGQLVMSSTGSGGSGACQSSIAVPFTAVSVQILRATANANAKTGIRLTFGDSTTFAVELRGVGSANQLYTDNDGTANPVGGYMSTMTNFRLEANGPDRIVLTVSNGISSTISNDFYAPGMHAMARVRLYTDFGSNTSYTLSEFDNLDGCAP